MEYNLEKWLGSPTGIRLGCLTAAVRALDGSAWKPDDLAASALSIATRFEKYVREGGGP